MTLRYRDDEERSKGGIVFLALGAAAGIAAGVMLAQKYGGLAALGARIRDELEERFPERFARAGGARVGAGAEVADDEDELERLGGIGDEYDDEYDVEGDDPQSDLEGRVLGAFTNDPILSQRPVDIGALSEGVIELTGSVYTEDERSQAVTIARGVPGVDTVVNRLAVIEEEAEYEAAAERYLSGDPAATEAHWEGQHVGTGQRRQGNSKEADRHADPKVGLENRWLSKEEAVRAAADDTGALTGRRESSKKPPRGGRADGSPVAPTGVPKADHVADPLHADPGKRG